MQQIVTEQNQRLTLNTHVHLNIKTQAIPTASLTFGASTKILSVLGSNRRDVPRILRVLRFALTVLFRNT
jgi:hypothetical protein